MAILGPDAPTLHYKTPNWFEIERYLVFLLSKVRNFHEFPTGGQLIDVEYAMTLGKVS